MVLFLVSLLIPRDISHATCANLAHLTYLLVRFEFLSSHCNLLSSHVSSHAYTLIVVSTETHYSDHMMCTIIYIVSLCQATATARKGIEGATESLQCRSETTSRKTLARSWKACLHTNIASCMALSSAPTVFLILATKTLPANYKL